MSSLRTKANESRTTSAGRTGHRFGAVRPILTVAVLATGLPALGQRTPAKKDDAPVIMSTRKYQEKYNPRTAEKPFETGTRAERSLHSAKFYGTTAPGETFVFVIDNSTSMHEGGRLARAHAELQRCVGTLHWPQRFHVIAFDLKTTELPGGPFVTAGSDDVRRLGPWLASLQQGDGTFPGRAMRMAVGLKPDAVFFLTDGLFDEPGPGQIRAWNKARVPVFVIDLKPGPPSESLRRIAADSGGQYRKAR